MTGQFRLTKNLKPITNGYENYYKKTQTDCSIQLPKTLTAICYVQEGEGGDGGMHQK